jgi:dolichol-phosphate mannosyltransferase
MEKRTKKSLVTVVIPVFNEAKSINTLIDKLERVRERLKDSYEFELIFVNDGSTDETYEMILSSSDRMRHIKLVDLSRNFGNQIAVTAGVHEANGDIVITMDGDLQHPPALIPDLIAEWEKGYEVVQAKRVRYRNPGLLKNLLSFAYFFLMNRISAVRIERDVSDMRLMDRKAVEYFNRVTERRRFVRGIVNWLGFRRSYVEYRVEPRLDGNSSFSLWKLLKLAMTGLTAFSLMPLKIASFLGGLITFCSFILLASMSYIHFFVNNEMFRPIAFFAVLNALMSGLILVCLGLLSIYIGNIHEEVKNRPLYVVREKVNFGEKENVKNVTTVVEE